jgi:hypothetical protein
MREPETARQADVEQNDFLSWLIDEVFESGPERCNVKELALRIVGLNFAAIHTTTMVCGTRFSTRHAPV